MLRVGCCVIWRVLLPTAGRHHRPCAAAAQAFDDTVLAGLIRSRARSARVWCSGGRRQREWPCQLGAAGRFRGLSGPGLGSWREPFKVHVGLRSGRRWSRCSTIPRARRYPGHREVLHQVFERPPQPATGQLRSRLRRLAGLLAPTCPHARIRCSGSRRTVTCRLVGRHPNGSCVSQRTTVPRGTPWQPHRWHQSAGSTTRQSSRVCTGWM